MAILSEVCPPEVWREIVSAAVKQARFGQEKPREWLASYLLGKPSLGAPSLHELAVDAAMGTDPVASDAEERRRLAELLGLFP